MLCWLFAAALAQVEPTYRRIDEPLSIRTGAEIRGDGPARLGGRGPIRAWVFPDGHIEHYVRLDGDRPAELVRYDAHLSKHLTVTYVDGTATEVIVHAASDHAVPIATWVEVDLEGAKLRLPSAGVDVAIGDGRFRATWSPKATYRDATVLRDLEQSLGGRVLAHQTTWIDGTAGVRLTLTIPHPTDPRVAEGWVIPRDEGLFLATWVAPKGEAPLSLDTLAPGRAAMALVTWQDTP